MLLDIRFATRGEAEQSEAKLEGRSRIYDLTNNQQLSTDNRQLKLLPKEILQNSSGK